jgi:hypothetical protein
LTREEFETFWAQIDASAVFRNLTRVVTAGSSVVDFGDMKIGEKIKRLSQRQASAETQDERAARAKAERERDQVLEEAAIKSQVDAGLSGGPQIPPF